MGTKSRFLINNLIDNATLTSGTGHIEPNLPVDNLKLVSKSRVARSVKGLNTVSIYGEFTQASPVTGFVIGNHNLSENATYQLNIYPTVDRSGPKSYYYMDGQRTVTSDRAAVNTGEFQYNIPIWLYDENYPTVPLIVGSFELVLNKASADDYVQLSRIFMGDAIEPAIGASLGNSLYWKDYSNQFRTEDGSLRSDIINPSKVIEFSLNTMNDSDRQHLQRAFAKVGKREDFFVSLFPYSCTAGKEQDYSGIVKLTKIPRYSEFAQNFYSAKYIVEEV